MKPGRELCPRRVLTTDDVQSDAGGVQVCGLARVVALVGLDCALDAVCGVGWKEGFEVIYLMLIKRKQFSHLYVRKAPCKDAYRPNSNPIAAASL